MNKPNLLRGGRALFLPRDSLRRSRRCRIHTHTKSVARSRGSLWLPCLRYSNLFSSSQIPATSRKIQTSLTAKDPEGEKTDGKNGAFEGEAAIDQATQLSNAILGSDHIPTDDLVMRALDACRSAAIHLSDNQQVRTNIKSQAYSIMTLRH